MSYRILSRAKNMLVPKGKRPRKVRLGLYKGLTIEADLEHDMQLLTGLWERETYSCIRIAAARCDWAIDIGAGNGELVLFLLRECEAKPVIAVEPRLEANQAIERNLRLNRMLADRLAIRTNYVGVDKDAGQISLDSLATSLIGRGFIKLDVDGGELDVLRSGTECLTRTGLDLLIETHSSQLEIECMDLLKKYAFTCSIIKNAWWRAILPELRPIDHNRWIWATHIQGLPSAAFMESLRVTKVGGWVLQRGYENLRL